MKKDPKDPREDYNLEKDRKMEPTWPMDDRPVNQAKRYEIGSKGIAPQSEDGGEKKEAPEQGKDA
ncbi:hypothetical protein ABB02_00594 [Clostridiaceae bacterium JG1575]|nr:hypothetical protein ABB02_00594 [Clostridiaceae bacterium JG1575]